MSTSKLQRYTSEQLYKRFGKYGLVENRHPGWLVSSKGERLELDFFIDKLSMAVEVQGGQHIEFTPLFHTTEHDFTEQLRRDGEKKDLCDRAGIHLLYVYKKSDVEIVLYEIHAKIENVLNGGEEEEEFLFYAEEINHTMKGAGRTKKGQKSKGRKQGSKPRSLQEKVPGRIKNLQLFLDNGSPGEIFIKQTAKRVERLNKRVVSGEIVLQDDQAAIVQKAGQRVSTMI